MNVNKMGWVVAAVLAGGVAGFGFRAPGDKTGTVDIQRVFNESNFTKTQNDSLHELQQNRIAIVEFLRTYPLLKPEEAAQFRTLSVKTNPTAAEKAQIEQIKLDGQAAENKYRQLSTKAAPSKEDLAAIEEFNKNKDANGQQFQQVQSDFSQEVQTKMAGLREEALTKVKDVIRKIAADQGYSMIFDSAVAPYSSNDITDAAMKALNK